MLRGGTQAGNGRILLVSARIELISQEAGR